jgi:hypothetical protein
MFSRESERQPEGEGEIETGGRVGETETPRRVGELGTDRPEKAPGGSGLWSKTTIKTFKSIQPNVM